MQAASKPGLDGNGTIGELYRRARSLIEPLDARWLLAECLALDARQLLTYPEWPVARADAERFWHWVEQRQQGHPLAYLVGYTDFYGRRFTVTSDVLVPRPETEELVDRALAHLASSCRQGSSPMRLIDLGTGSGNIAISLALAARQRGIAVHLTAVDYSAAALRVAAANALHHGVTIDWRHGDWWQALNDDERFDMVVSNPPYVADGDPHLCGDGLAFEPQLALCGNHPNHDGLAAIKRIADGAVARLNPAAKILVEHGSTQGAACRQLFQSLGFSAIVSYRDMAEHERITAASVPG